jgi:hypothetical protein
VVRGWWGILGGRCRRASDHADANHVSEGTWCLRDEATLPNRARDRAEVEKISGQRAVPILVLDGGEVIKGSGDIVSWARENEPQATAAN